ncbi:MAG: glycosyl hydrolase family 18 protein, partial [Clostridium sp.]
MGKIKFKKIVAAAMLSVFTIMTCTINTNAAPTEEENSKALTAKDLERKVVGYFPEWAYKSEAQGFFDVADLQWDSLTHIQYSFAMVGSDNKIAFGNKEAAIEETFAGRKLEYKGQEIKLDPNLPYKGHFNVMQQMKKQFPDVDLLISIGGWAGTRGFYDMIKTD